MKTSRPCLGPWLMSSLGKGACAWEPANQAGWQHPSLPAVSPVTPLRGQHQPRASSLLLPTKGEKSQDVGWEKSKIGKMHPGACEWLGFCTPSLSEDPPVPKRQRGLVFVLLGKGL